jgi:membrane-bound lytic murein transglycosylase B
MFEASLPHPLRLIVGFGLLVSAICAAEDYGDHPQVAPFTAEMASKHGFDRTALAQLFDRTQHRPEIIALMRRPAEAKPWYVYRDIFLTEERIAAGAAYLETHDPLFQRAERDFGVDPVIIAAIIGVETHYGRNVGRHRVMDALATLAFDYPPRAPFFRSELEQFLLLSLEEGFDPLTVTGSYAGAMGVSQFIASSYRRYAVDGDGDGNRDLWSSPADVIASVANYFAEHGWRRGEPVAVRAAVRGSELASLLSAELRPHLTVAELGRKGVHPETGLPATAIATLIELENGTGMEYWIGLQNFYVITRYNHSPKYAMAVHQLGGAIRDRLALAEQRSQGATNRRLPPG